MPDTGRDVHEGSLAHVCLVLATDEPVATLEHQESFAMLAMNVWDRSTQDRPRLLDQLERATCLGRAGHDSHWGRVTRGPPADTSAQWPGVRLHCGRDHSAVTLVQPICARSMPQQSRDTGEKPS